jgi:hypothetical protein
MAIGQVNGKGYGCFRDGDVVGKLGTVYLETIPLERLAIFQLRNDCLEEIAGNVSRRTRKAQTTMQ